MNVVHLAQQTESVETVVNLLSCDVAANGDVLNNEGLWLTMARRLSASWLKIKG